MKSNAKESKGVSATTGTESDESTGNSKKAKKVSYEKQLDDIVKELRSKSANNAQGKGARKLKPERELVLLEQKCILLLKLKRHKEVVDDGYSIIGRLGPNIIVYKCILIALVRLGKPEEDIIELLEAWKKATPKCTQMLETSRKFDGYIAALRSGVKHNDIFSGIEDALELNADNVLNKQVSSMDEPENKWRFRAPPPRHTTFSLCPRASSVNSCIYGEECLFAHSQEELKEWKSRVEGDKKNNGSTEEMAEENNRVFKKRPIPLIYRSLLIPPLCIHYLLDLGKKIKDAVNIQDVLLDEIPNVKIRIGTPLRYQKRIDGNSSIQCLWSFMVGSKMPMGTVSILHDSNRESFSITNALYYNKKKESLSLIELHPNNKVQAKLQVLNTFIQPSLFLRFNAGWPDTCYYKVDIVFDSRGPFPEPGLYRQSIVFDFKKDPKVVKHISVEILPKIEPIGNHLENNPLPVKSPWGSTQSALVDHRSELSPSLDEFPPPQTSMNMTVYDAFENEQINLLRRDSASVDVYREERVPECSFKAVGFKKLDVVDSETGKSIKLNGLMSQGSYDSDASKDDNLFLEDITLTKENYRSWMHDFLDVETTARQKAVKQIKTLVDVTLLKKYSPTADCIYKFNCTGDLYGKIEMLSDIALDPKLDRLIASSSTSVLIYKSTDTVTVSFRKTTPRYLCRIVEKSKSAIFIAIGKVAVDELLLLPDSLRQLHVQFILDPYSFERMKFCIDALSRHHMNLLFPAFENSQLQILKVLSSSTFPNEEELFLNSRQQLVYNIISGRKGLIDSEIPPVILTGGPSTGKSHLLAHCVRGLLRTQNSPVPTRILICTRTDVAADIFITEYLHRWLINDELSVQRSKPLRVYDSDRFVDSVSGAVKHYCLFDYDGANFRLPTKEEILSHRIIIVTVSTCYTLLGMGLDNDTFSHIIIDEAAQCLEAECIQPIVLAGKFTRLIVSGDVVVTESQMFTEPTRVSPLSLIERLRNVYPFRHPFVVNLVENYCNHEVILKFISGTFYHDQLRPASNQPCHPSYYPLGFHHISSSKELQPDNGGGYYNMEEIRCITDFIDELLRSWPGTWGKPQDKDSLVIVSPYMNHLMALRVQLQLKGLQWINVELAFNLTSKRYRVVIISTVRTHKFDIQENLCMPQEKENGFFSNKWLVNAAISCARSLVMVFGDLRSLLQHGDCRDVWHKFAKECQTHDSLHGFTAQDGLQMESPVRKERQTVPVTKAEPQFSTGVKEVGLNLTNLRLNQSSLLRNDKNSPIQVPPSKDNLPLGKTNVSFSTEATEGDKKVHASPWNSDTLSNAPKSDLFSAFSSDVQPLYSSSPLPNKGDENNILTSSENATLGSSRATQSSIHSTSNMSKAPGPPTTRKESIQTHQLGLKNDLNTEVHQPILLGKMPELGMNIPSKSVLDTFTGPFELPRTRQSSTMDALGKDTKLKQGESVKLLSDVNLTEPQSMPLPVPTIPSQVLFDTKFVVDSSEGNAMLPKSYESISCEAMGSSNSPCLSPQSFASPLMRGPPGFAPISHESKMGGFPALESRVSYPPSPFKTFMGNGNGNGKAVFKRNAYTYELPPRMLKLHYQKSPPHRKPVSRPTQPAEMNFFEELGLDSQRESGRSESSASSEHSFIDREETISIVDEDGSNASPQQSDWIEVKSTRKGKHPHGKKQKSKEKRATATTEDGSHTEMCVDDKVELITQMGFTKSEAVKALVACDKDLQRAVDWLISKPTKPGS